MVKGVIAGFENASLDRSVVAVIFTGTGSFAFCTGGNTKEYSEFYSLRSDEYGQYMDLFNHMVDSILMCKKPTICAPPPAADQVSVPRTIRQAERKAGVQAHMPKSSQL